MDNETLVLETTTTPALPTEPVLTEAPIETPAVEEKTYVYQPTDEQGRPIGGKQVIKYVTQEDLVSKLQEQNVLILRKLRSETRKNRLGITDESEAPADGQRFSAPIEFKSLDLSPDEAVALSQDLLDPSRQAEARATLWKSVTGVDPDTFNATMSKLQFDNIKLQAKIEADAFVSNNKDYVICDENFQAITNWMMRYELAPVRDNFQKAFNALKAADVLILPGETVTPQAPTLAIEPISQIEIPLVPEPVKPQEFAPARIPSGLTRDSGGDGVPTPPVTGEDIVYQEIRNNKIFATHIGKKALDAMPADEYKRRVLYEKGFREKADALDKRK